MLQKIKASRLSLAFYLGISFILIGLALTNYSDKTVNQALLENSDFIVLVVSAVLVAPVLEEFIFRSYFTEKPKLFGLAMFLLAFQALDSSITYPSHLIMSSIGVWSIFNYRKRKTEKALWVAIIASSLFFAQSHYSVGYSLYSFLDFAYIQLGIGFIFSWIVINYKLMYSMLAHAIFNTTLMFLGFLSIQVIMEPKTTIENDHIQITYSQIPYFGAEPSMGEKVSKLLWRIKSSSINELRTQITEMTNDSTVVISRIPFSHYNFDIMSIDGQEIKATEVYQLLEEKEFLSIGED